MCKGLNWNYTIKDRKLDLSFKIAAVKWYGIFLRASNRHGIFVFSISRHIDYQWRTSAEGFVWKITSGYTAGKINLRKLLPTHYMHILCYGAISRYFYVLLYGAQAKQVNSCKRSTVREYWGALQYSMRLRRARFSRLEMNWMTAAVFAQLIWSDVKQSGC